MFLVRVALGRIYIHDHFSSGESELNSLPCTTRKCFTPGCTVHSEKFNSALAGLDKRFREFLLYHSHQCYPHVLVFYDRTNQVTTTEEYNIPCYVIGPSSEIKHFKHKRDDKSKQDKFHWEHEAATKHGFENSLNATADETSSAKENSEVDADSDFAKILLGMYNTNQMEREHKMNHVTALYKLIPVTACSSDGEDGTLQSTRVELLTTRNKLKITDIKISRLVETLNRSYKLSGDLSKSVTDELEENVASFNDLFSEFNMRFRMWRNNHGSCTVHNN